MVCKITLLLFCVCIVMSSYIVKRSAMNITLVSLEGLFNDSVMLLCNVIEVVSFITVSYFYTTVVYLGNNLHIIRYRHP